MTATDRLVELARDLGRESAAQCSPGEEWAPADYLQGDLDALADRAEELGILVDPQIERALWSAYTQEGH